MPKSTFSVVEMNEKKVEVAAVIDFCDANGISCNKGKIFDFFGVPRTSGYRWYPDTYSPNHRRLKQPTDIETPSTSQTSQEQHTPEKRQNPVRNGGRDRKRLKSIIEGLAEEVSDVSSPPPLSSPSSSLSASSLLTEQPLTPPKRKIAQPRKKTGSHPGRQLRYEEVTQIKQEGMDDEIEV